MSTPTLLVVGTTYGAANKKEVLAHVRGLAHRMTTSAERAYYSFRKWKDSTGRPCYLYEIQEGGEVSVLDGVEQLLSDGKSITFALAGNHYAEITHDNGAVLTVVHEAKHHQPEELYDIPTSGKPMKSIDGDGSEIRLAGLAVFGLGLFTLLGAITFAFFAGTVSPKVPVNQVLQTTPASALKRIQDGLEPHQYIIEIRYSRATNEYTSQVGDVSRRHASQPNSQDTHSQTVSRPQPDKRDDTIWN